MCAKYVPLYERGYGEADGISYASHLKILSPSDSSTSSKSSPDRDDLWDFQSQKGAQKTPKILRQASEWHNSLFVT